MTRSRPLLKSPPSNPRAALPAHGDICRAKLWISVHPGRAHLTRAAKGIPRDPSPGSRVREANHLPHGAYAAIDGSREGATEGIDPPSFKQVKHGRKQLMFPLWPFACCSRFRLFLKRRHVFSTSSQKEIGFTKVSVGLMSIWPQGRGI